MDRVKKIEEVILAPTDVLVEIVEQATKSGIILPDDSIADEASLSYGLVVAKGEQVVDLEVGDIVLKTRTDKAAGYERKGKDLILVPRYNIAIAIKRENFLSSEELSS